MSRRDYTDAKNRLSKETGTVIKDWGGKFPVALVYPNSYYIGMSSLGIASIYGLLNGLQDTVCERFFLEKNDRFPILSIESQRPLPDFPVIGFSVSYELDYFNVVNILKNSGIPLYAAERDERPPLVIAGGPCITSNPMPLAPFFDCLCIGEGEAILPQMLPFFRKSMKREELLTELAAIPGVCVFQATNEKPLPGSGSKTWTLFRRTPSS
jgi:radical SAM superfamily enzyme YgiQ (UPF0313 family)